MAQSIWNAGLIQNIAGLEDGNGGAEIVAGGRRLRALQLLASKHENFAVQRPELAMPLVMLAPDAATAQTWAGLENVARRNLHPAEEIRAYGKMAESGSNPASIARAFAVSEKHVYRRLALANLPAPVIDALEKNEINLSMAACFTISDDEGNSLAVLETVRGYNYSDHQLKKLLKPDSVKGSDRRALFVGEEIYREAGGLIGGDLFADEPLFDSPEILDECFHVALDNAARATREAEGWAWVEPVPDRTWICSYSMELDKFGRVYPLEGDLTEKQADTLGELEEKSYDTSLSKEDQGELDALQAIVNGAYSDEQKTFSGAFIFVTNDGQVKLEPGYIKPESKKAAIEAGVLQASPHAKDSAPKSPISAKLADDLKRISRGAQQHALLDNSDLILELLAYQLRHELDWRSPFGMTPVEVPTQPSTADNGYALDDRLTTALKGDMWDKNLAKSFRAYRNKGSEKIMTDLSNALAALFSGGCDELRALVAKECKAKTRDVWTPTAENFFKRVSGPYLNELWADLLEIPLDHPTATTFLKLKKGEKAQKLEALFGDPDTQSVLHLTKEQISRIAAWLPEGME